MRSRRQGRLRRFARNGPTCERDRGFGVSMAQRGLGSARGIAVLHRLGGLRRCLQPARRRSVWLEPEEEWSRPHAPSDFTRVGGQRAVLRALPRMSSAPKVGSLDSPLEEFEPSVPDEGKPTHASITFDRYRWLSRRSESGAADLWR